MICSKCHTSFVKEQVEKDEWNKYCGDKDLYEKYSHAQVMYKGKVVSEPCKIAAIYRSYGGISVNLCERGSFPQCDKTKSPRILRIRNGYFCDALLLLEREKVIKKD